jgi:hypothetical protein
MRTKRLMDDISRFRQPAPSRFGQHPDFDFKKYQREACSVLGKRERARDLETAEKRTYEFMEISEKRKLSLSALFNPVHPEVFLIPRNRFSHVVDEWDDDIGFERTVFPFSSTDFYVDVDKEGSVFYEIVHNPAFQRLAGISQLGYLVPPRPKEWDKNVSIAYLTPQFPHNRWIHSLLVAIIIEAILARNGFPKRERIPVVLAAGFHDIAIPAGGDSVKRVDPDNLGEEESFAWLIRYHGLDKRWQEQFGFDLALAERWVAGKGLFGQLLDFVDKISYTALDCFHLGVQRKGKVRSLCLKNPLVMDVWQDIVATDRNSFAFSNPDNLFNFLLLRAYEFQELLYNPYSRALDLFLKKMVQPLYRKKIITKEQLLTQDDNWLKQVLENHYPGQVKWYIEPEELVWKKFGTEKEQEEFCKRLGGRLDHAEYISEFDTGLDFPVLKGDRVVPLREVISPKRTMLLERVAGSMKGYYAYYNLRKS